VTNLQELKSRSVSFPENNVSCLRLGLHRIRYSIWLWNSCLLLFVINLLQYIGFYLSHDAFPFSIFSFTQFHIFQFHLPEMFNNLAGEISEITWMSFRYCLFVLDFLERKLIISNSFITFYNILFVYFIYFIFLHALYFICFYLNTNIEIISCKQFRWCGLYADAGYLLYIEYCKAKFLRCGLYDAYLPEITVCIMPNSLHFSRFRPM